MNQSARRAVRVAQAQRRLEAYAGLLVAAGDVLGTCRQTQATMDKFAQLDADEANRRMADLASALHRGSAVVALTGSAPGRRYGEILYTEARKVAASRLVPLPGLQVRGQFQLVIGGSAEELEATIEDYEAALIPEITSLP